MRVFQIIKRVVASGAAGFSDSFSLGIKAVDTNAVPTDAATFLLRLAQSDTNAAQSETVKLTFPAGVWADSNVAPTEVRSMAIRSWATGCVDNDSSQTTPANANGQNNGTPHTLVKTNNALADLTNPVVVTTGAMNWPGGTVVGDKKLRLYFSVGVNLLTADTIKITYSDGTLSGNAWLAGSGAEDHLSQANSLVFVLPAAINLSLLVLTCSYQAAVVALPQTVVTLDAWCIEATVII